MDGGASTSARKRKSQDEYHVPKTDTVDYRIINFVTVFLAIASLVKFAQCNSKISFGWLVNWLVNCLCILARLFVTTVIRLKKCRMLFGLLSNTRVLPTRNRSITSVHQVLTRGVRSTSKGREEVEVFQTRLDCLAKGSRRCNKTYLWKS